MKPIRVRVISFSEIVGKRKENQWIGTIGRFRIRVPTNVDDSADSDSTNHDFQKKLTSVSLLWKSCLPISKCVEASDQVSMHCPCGDRLTLPGQKMIGHS